MPRCHSSTGFRPQKSDTEQRWAVEHEVARADLRTLLDELEAELGPADPAMVDEAEAMLESLEQQARRAPKHRAAG